MAPTIRDVAKLAGVSHTTVSNVINNVPRVGMQTRQKVLEVMETLGFEPNFVAKSLYTKRSYTVGYMVPAITNGFFMSVARGAERVLYREDLSLFLCDTTLEASRESDYLRRLIRHQVDGIIFNYAADRKSVVRAIKAGIPIVAIESPIDVPGASLVQVDNAAAAMIGVEHLAALGHNRIGVIAIDFESDVNSERMRGFRNGMKIHDLPLREELLMRISGNRWDAYFDQMDDLTMSPLPARRQFAKNVEGLLGLPDPPTAIFCFDYQSAILLVRSLTGMGLTLGRDVSVVGFDCAAVISAPQLTTISQPAMEMGAFAAEMLLERIANPGVKPRMLRLSAQLVIGETTGPPK